MRRRGCGLREELPGLLAALLAVDLQQAAGELDPADHARRVELQRPPVQRESGRGVGALRPADQPADVVDDLGVERAERDVRVGVPGGQLDRALERCLDLAARAFTTLLPWP